MSTLMSHLSPVWAHLTTIQPVRSEGVYLYEADGTRWTDFTSGIGVTNTGHCHPRVVAAIQEQAGKLLHGQINIVVAPAAIALSQALNEITPASIDTFFFSNSGAEAVEGAVKLARHATKKTNIIVFQGSFHGRTAQTMAMTMSKTVYRAGYQPLPGGIFVAPFPFVYEYERKFGWTEAQTVAYCLEQMHLLLKTQTAPVETAAIVIEPVLGEGGYVPAPKAFLEGLREICDEHGILLVVDEVQTGFGRTGKMFGIDHSGVSPDIMIMAKGLGSGVPISCVGASAEIMSRWGVGSHGGTYGGNALATAAALATIQVLREESLSEQAAQRGMRLTEGLRALQAEFPIIGDVRGQGLMIGTEFVRSGKPDTAVVKKIQAACAEKRLLLLTCGAYENVVRWIPPLVVSDDQIDEALQIFAEAVASAI